MRELMPTVNVPRGPTTTVLPLALRDDIDAIPFLPIGKSTAMTWAESLEANYTDGILVLHRGRIVYERYFGGLKENLPHAAMSVTKSFVGTLGALLMAEGTLEPNAVAATYVPELESSAFGDATIRDIVDMTTAIQFSEDYSDPQAEVWKHAAAGNPLPKPPGYEGPRTYFDFIQTVKKNGEHGATFGYKTVNTDALGWILARTTGLSVAELISERFWIPLGAEFDAYLSVDSIGTPFAGGGFNACLRDLARFGEMLRNGGMFAGRRILPESVVDDIRKGGDRELFSQAGYSTLPGWSYRNMWWVSHDDHGAYAARGVHGQTIYIDPKAEMVIVRFSSHPVAFNSAIDPTSLPAYRALAEHLLHNAR